jgi:signal transduction histidine kinase
VGGSIDVSSRLGEGTLVVAALPLRPHHNLTAIAPNQPVS